MSDRITDLPATAQAAELRAKEISSRGLFAGMWGRYQAANGALNAIVQVDPERALARVPRRRRGVGVGVRVVSPPG